MRSVMVIDLKKCVGCNACTIACKAENGTRPGVTRCKVMKKEDGKYPNTRRRSLPMLCMQCQNPACVGVCPTGATKTNSDGIVVVDKDICIGCRACSTACPYSARYFSESAEGYFGKELSPFEKVAYQTMQIGVIDKCDFCESRRKDGLEPACVETCITSCRYFGTKESLEELIIERHGEQLRPELGTDPSVYYLF